MFGSQLTEFEKIEMGMYERVYTIGNVRRHNQYSISNTDGQYLVQPGEQIAFRYCVVNVIDSGAFGQVLLCQDCLSDTQVAVKLSKNKKFDVDNANVEIRFCKKLMAGHSDDNEGRE